MTAESIIKLAKVSAINGFGRRFTIVNGWLTPIGVQRDYNYDGRAGHRKVTFSVLLRGHPIRCGMSFKDARMLALQMAVEQWERRRAPRSEFRVALERLGFTQVGFARYIGVNARTVRSWVSGRSPVPRTTTVLLAALEKQNNPSLDCPVSQT